MQFGMQACVLALKICVFLNLTGGATDTTPSQPGIQAVRRNSQPLGYLGHRVPPFGHLLDRLRLALIRVTLAAHVPSSLKHTLSFVYEARGEPWA